MLVKLAPGQMIVGRSAATSLLLLTSKRKVFFSLLFSDNKSVFCREKMKKTTNQRNITDRK
jgi:hypothetical protein